MKILNRITSQQGFIDLHNHTDYSFGWEMGLMHWSPLNYLEEAREYADKYNKPVTFAITDHNNVNANRKILAEIKKNPEKYKNIRYIPGCEYTVSCDSLGHCYDKDGNEKPIVSDNRLHMLAYGMDLENPTIKYLNDCMSTAKRHVREYVTKYKPVKFGNIIFATRAWLKTKNIDTQLSDFQDDCQLQKTFDETVGVVDKFLRNKYKLSEKDMKEWSKFVNDKDNIIKYTKIDVQELMSIVEKAGGYTVLAHPVYAGPSEDFQHIDDPDNKDPRNDKLRNLAFDDVSYKRLPEDLKQRNLRKMENYYDYIYRSLTIHAKNPITGEKLQGIVGHELMHSANQKNQYKFDVMMKTGDKYGLYCTGGSDSHGFLNKYVIPSRVVGSQVQKYDTNYDSYTSAYALVKCNFADDFIKAQETGERLHREVGRDARNELTVLKTQDGVEKYYDMNQFREVVFKSYERKKKAEVQTVAMSTEEERIKKIRDEKKQLLQYKKELLLAQKQAQLEPEEKQKVKTLVRRQRARNVQLELEDGYTYSR